MKNYRSKLINGRWYPQKRVYWFFVIPTPFWSNFYFNYGDDDLLGLGPTAYSFSKKSDSDLFIENTP